uniref:Craniofacial development protein 1 n=2 Tax=Pectinophora gossypiella TaxID=13191 RepID=A0A1E1W1C1_PECGO
MSSGSDSDEDFVPGEPEQLSEEESADDETDLQYEKEQEHKARKRKAAEEATDKKKRKTKRGVKEVEEVKPPVEEKPVPEVLSPEEEKKKADDLWAKFLEGTDTKPKPKVSAIAEAPKPTVSTIKPQTADVKQNKEDDKARERRIFEFAGETIVVENNIIKEKIKAADTPAAVKLGGPSRSRGGGLSNVLGQLNQKNKLSTLEKSKLDWATYKQEEGIEEEIQSHNKGKHGYLERQDFLERADLRQYEIERELRMSRRSNR